MSEKTSFDNAADIIAEAERMMSANRYHAYRRYFARCLDHIVLTILAFLFLVVFIFLASLILTILENLDIGLSDLIARAKTPNRVFYSFFIFYFLSIIVSFFFEAYLINQFETTPGKFLFGIKVVDSDNVTLSFSKALKRRFLVFIKGLALNIPIITIFPLLFAYNKLVKTGSTSWDKSVGSVVLYKKLGFIHKTICVIISIPLFFISILRITGILYMIPKS